MRIVQILWVVILIFGCNEDIPKRYTTTDQNIDITPDYRDIILPPNIAPLNFRIDEQADLYCVKIYGKSGKSITIVSTSGRIKIPENTWHALLASNRGHDLLYDIYLKKNNWYQYKSFKNHVAEEDVDRYVVYRKIHPSHNTWSVMGLYQRDLLTFREETILDNNNFQQGCCHCHAFLDNKPDHILIGIRSPEYRSGLLLVKDNEVQEIGVRFGFTTWHPGGQQVVFSMNMPRLLLHTQRNEMRDIVDLDSWIGYFDLNLNKANEIPGLTHKDRLENYPVFSPDGNYLYYTEAPKLWNQTKKIDTEYYNQVKYSLMRIPYDAPNNQWGQPELLLSAQETGLSINQPRLSPDGRWISFAMCAYGCWPSYHPNSDLYLLDLQTRSKTGRYSYKKMEINSEECESWQGWSLNSRWLVFSSKRNNPLYNRIYLAYIDTIGQSYKAFVIPQEEPDFYESYLKTYTIPELLARPMEVKGEDLAEYIRAANKVPLAMPITGATTRIEKRKIYHQ
jgi:hypothetical protein